MWAPAAEATPAATVLRLQRAIGNAATTRLLQRQPAAAVTAADAQAAARRALARTGWERKASAYPAMWHFLHARLKPEAGDRLSGSHYDDKVVGWRLTPELGSQRYQAVLTCGEDVLKRLAAGRFDELERELRPLLDAIDKRNVDEGYVLGAPALSLEQALDEGARELHPEFGLAGGNAPGPDSGDGYDAREWEEQASPRGVLQAKVEPWLAMKHLVQNIKAGAQVPKAGGGTTKWSADCFEFVVLLRIYAFWRTMTRPAFNQRFTPLQLGFHARRTHLAWKEIIHATKPGEPPFRWGEETSSTSSAGISFDQKKIPVGRTWKQILQDAPIGTQVIWSNKDATAQCTKDPNLSFCAFMNENTTKVGDGRYAAHPFGIVDEATIVTKMAKAVVGENIPPGYIQRNIYISAVRPPGD